MYAWDEGSL